MIFTFNIFNEKNIEGRRESEKIEVRIIKETVSSAFSK